MANKVRLSSISGTVGKALMDNIEELNNVKNTEELYTFLDKLLLEVPGTGKFKFMQVLDRKKTFEEKFLYVYNYALAGDGLRAYQTNYVKDGKRRTNNLIVGK